MRNERRHKQDKKETEVSCPGGNEREETDMPKHYTHFLNRCHWQSYTTKVVAIDNKQP